MLYSKIIVVCSEFHTKHINTLCGQNVQLVNVKAVVPLDFKRLTHIQIISNKKCNRKCLTACTAWGKKLKFNSPAAFCIFFNFRDVNDTDRDPSNVTDVVLVQCIY